MNIYSKKQLWKYILSVIGGLIIIFSFWYSNVLVSKIAEDERSKVKLWADAINKKATLVRITGELFSELANEERKKVELWAEATKKLATSKGDEDFTFLLKVVANNTTVPVILTDENKNIISHRNLPDSIIKNQKLLEKEISNMESLNKPIEIVIYGNKKNYLFYKDSKIFSDLKNTLDNIIKSFISEIVINSASVPVLFVNENDSSVIAFGNIDESKINNKEKLANTISKMKLENKPIKINLNENQTSYIYYQDSFLLTQLKYYPYIQFGVIGLFILIAYWLFSVARKAEQNQVWVGLAKETAHQLGTPLSSLMAWNEILKSSGVDDATTSEMNKDIKRLETITDRFSKIGSEPKLETQALYPVLTNAIEYIKDRTSKNIHFSINNFDKNLQIKVTPSLFNWVIENLCKNAIDAMNGKGDLSIKVTENSQDVYIDVSDTGKGIPSSKFKTIFEPGYTTKQRGWGLGLSLAKRIIENYHKGKIFVKESEEGKGTTFRIILNKNKI